MIDPGTGIGYCPYCGNTKVEHECKEVFIETTHCSSCGQEDEANRFNQGYSSCCNKRISYPTTEADPCKATSCYHQLNS